VKDKRQHDIGVRRTKNIKINQNDWILHTIKTAKILKVILLYYYFFTLGTYDPEGVLKIIGKIRK